MAYYTGFLIERPRSMDNVFVIALIFGFFAIPRAHQHRVLVRGIVGVIVLRALMIGLGANPVLRWMRRPMSISDSLHGNRFWVRLPDPAAPTRNAWFATPLLLALALALVLIGTKIFLVGLVGKIPPSVSLTVTFGLLLGGVVFSLLKTRPSAVR